MILAEVKRQKIVSCPMNYKLLTPPWMKSTVYFVYGPTRNKTIPFTSGELPRKEILRGADKKLLLCAIIAAWMKEKPSTCSHLLQLLRNRNILLLNKPSDENPPPSFNQSLASNHSRENPVQFESHPLNAVSISSDSRLTHSAYTRSPGISSPSE